MKILGIVMLVMLLTSMTAVTAQDAESIDSFEDCIEAGNLIMVPIPGPDGQVAPRRCEANGQIFVEDINDGNVEDDIDTDNIDEATEDTSDIELEGDAGVTPDSALYGIDRALERISLLLTLDKAKKAEKGLEHAQERLLEVKKMAQERNVEAMKKAQQFHDEQIERVRARISELQEDTEAPKVKNTIKKVIALQNRIELHELRIETLQDVLAEQNLTDEQEEIVEGLVTKMKAKATLMKQTAEQRKESIKTRLRAVTEQTEDEINEEIEAIEDSAGLTEARKLRAKKFIEKTEDALEKIQERLLEEKLKNVNVTALEEHIANVKQLVEEAKIKLAEGNYEGAIDVLKDINNYGRNMNVIVRKMRVARELGKNADIDEQIKQAKLKHIAVLEEIAEKVPENASVKIKANIERAKTKTSVKIGTGTKAETETD